MALRERFTEALKEAMKAKDARRLSTVRLILAAVKERDIASRTEESKEGVSDDEIFSVLAKMVKQREESAKVYENGGRPELAQAEREEIAIIQTFMPAQMDEAAMHAAVAATVAEVGAQSMKDMGKVMAALKAQFAGQMNIAKAGAAVKKLLAK